MFCRDQWRLLLLCGNLGHFPLVQNSSLVVVDVGLLDLALQKLKKRVDIPLAWSVTCLNTVFIIPLACSITCLNKSASVSVIYHVPKHIIYRSVSVIYHESEQRRISPFTSFITYLKHKMYRSVSIISQVSEHKMHYSVTVIFHVSATDNISFRQRDLSRVCNKQFIILLTVIHQVF